MEDDEGILSFSGEIYNYLERVSTTFFPIVKKYVRYVIKMPNFKEENIENILETANQLQIAGLTKSNPQENDANALWVKQCNYKRSKVCKSSQKETIITCSFLNEKSSILF